ncbi:PTS sugar transporter subunit IIA [Mangrovihabitans endophyticus]|uniref:Mannitol-specific phosphotransferase enzyme IIA component n=1 Tax=Mangrovihabitans endophyticus TaxID=1751298 RepID=A0A8J3FQF1_9ACTN|nr:PTS sugar transporter subunit IIA [Mangrovihabitans endophyticus]GGK97813.1 hypothetical protein GCM10012284_35050 [Mangrovihabitans endophyticus]
MLVRPLLSPYAVRLAEFAPDRAAAIHRCADVLEDIGAVAPAYRTSMLDRERLMSTYLGECVAIPHGMDSRLVQRDALAVLRLPDGVDWAGSRVTMCVAIAARGDGHIEMLANLAAILLDPPRAAALRSAAAPEDVIRMLGETT